MTAVKEDNATTATWSEHFSSAISDHRQKICDQLRSERQRIATAEQQFSTEIKQVANELTTASRMEYEEHELLATIVASLDSLRGDMALLLALPDPAPNLKANFYVDR